MYSGRSLPAFWTDVVLPFSGSKSKVSKQTASRLAMSAEHVARMRKECVPNFKRAATRRWETSTEMDLKDVPYQVVECFLLGQSRNQWLCFKHDNESLVSTKGRELLNRTSALVLKQDIGPCSYSITVIPRTVQPRTLCCIFESLTLEEN
jgi:hypothetical protein